MLDGPEFDQAEKLKKNYRRIEKDLNRGPEYFSIKRAFPALRSLAPGPSPAPSGGRNRPGGPGFGRCYSHGLGPRKQTVRKETPQRRRGVPGTSGRGWLEPPLGQLTKPGNGLAASQVPKGHTPMPDPSKGTAWPLSPTIQKAMAAVEGARPATTDNRAASRENSTCDSAAGTATFGGFVWSVPEAHVRMLSEADPSNTDFADGDYEKLRSRRGRRGFHQQRRWIRDTVRAAPSISARQLSTLKDLPLIGQGRGSIWRKRYLRCSKGGRSPGDAELPRISCQHPENSHIRWACPSQRPSTRKPAAGASSRRRHRPAPPRAGPGAKYVRRCTEKLSITGLSAATWLTWK